MGLDRPIKLFLIFAFASVSMAAIRHLWRVSAWHPGNQTEHPLSWHVSIVLHQTVLCIRQLVKHCLEITLRHINVLNNPASHLSQIPGMVSHVSHLPMCFSRCWFHKYASSFCLVEETPGDLTPVWINSKTSWASSPSRPTCRESLPYCLGSLIGKSESQCAYLMQHPRCSAPSESSSHEEIP